MGFNFGADGVKRGFCAGCVETRWMRLRMRGRRIMVKDVVRWDEWFWMSYTNVVQVIPGVIEVM